MNKPPSKKVLDQVRDYLLSQNPKQKGALIIPPELIQAAERGELPRTEQQSAVMRPKTGNKGPAEIPAANLPSSDHVSAPEAISDADVTPEKCGRGRPAHLPPWLEAAAIMVANGLTLRRALWKLGVSLSDKERKNVYRWKYFRQYYEEAREAFVTDWGLTPPREIARIRDSVVSGLDF